jgi:hypothetical protein
MTSVSIDLFQMPAVTWEGVEYDAFAACVDRMSGWIVATPHKLKGLTAAKVAKAMYERWWSPHGLPSVVTSDQGPHFAGAWWRTMCALHGVRQAYSQAYHHAANGRAEVAGEQIQKRLRKLQAEEGICWVLALPRAVQQIHDVPGQSGLSPYQVLYGRERPMAGVPYEPPKVMPDAAAFFKHQREVDWKVAKVLEDIHTKRAEQVNANRREASPFKPGDRVWWLRPRNRTGEKLESYWIGPSIVRQRVGEHSYMVEVAEGRVIPVHRSHLKPHVEDELLGEPVKLFQYRQAVRETELAPDEWLFDKITNHRRDANGDWEFLVKWQDSEQSTWEPLGHFFHKYADAFIKYCHEHRLRPDVIDHLLRHPAEVAVLRCDPISVQVVRAIQVVLRDTLQGTSAYSLCRIWEEPPEDCEVEWNDDNTPGVVTDASRPPAGLESEGTETELHEERRESKATVSRVSKSTNLSIAEMQAQCMREFDMQSGLVVHPPPGAQKYQNSKLPLDSVLGAAAGPPRVHAHQVPPELHKDTVASTRHACQMTKTGKDVKATMGVNRAQAAPTNGRDHNTLPHADEKTNQLSQADELRNGTSFRSGSKSRTRSRASQPSRWL